MSTSEKRKRAHQVGVRLDAEELAALRNVAAAEGVAVPELLRLAALDKVTKGEAVKPKAPPITHRFGEDDRAAIAELCSRLGICSGALVRAAKAVRKSGLSPRLHADIETELEAVRQIYRRGHDLLDGAVRR